jgi:hypothetical protein
MRPIQFVPFYLLWIVSSALSVLDWFLLRSALTAVASAIANAIPMEVQIRRQWYARWVVRAVDPCATAVLSVLLLVSIILFDYLYRAAIAKGTRSLSPFPPPWYNCWYLSIAMVYLLNNLGKPAQAPVSGVSSAPKH